MCISFIAALELSSGPICWLYMAEIMHDKALSVATVIGLLVMFLVAIFPPLIVERYGSNATSYIFIAGGILTTVGTIFIYFFM